MAYNSYSYPKKKEPANPTSDTTDNKETDGRLSLHVNATPQPQFTFSRAEFKETGLAK